MTCARGGSRDELFTAVDCLFKHTTRHTYRFSIELSCNLLISKRRTIKHSSSNYIDAIREFEILPVLRYRQVLTASIELFMLKRHAHWQAHKK